jgi:hypothetical protein
MRALACPVAGIAMSSASDTRPGFRVYGAGVMAGTATDVARVDAGGAAVAVAPMDIAPSVG